MTLVIEITCGFRNGDLLTGVSQLHRLNRAVQNHPVRRGDLLDLIFSEIQLLTRRHAVRPGRDRIHDLALCVMHDAVKRIDIFNSTNLKHCAGQALNRIDRFIDPVRFRDRPEYFAGLSDTDDTFLRHVGTGDFDQCDAAVLGCRVCGHIKIDRIRVQYIAIRGLDFHDGVALPERKHFRSDQVALLVGVEGVDRRQLRVGILHSDSGAVWVIDLERRTCIRDTQTRFRIRLLNFEISSKGGVVEQILIAASVFINENIEGRCQIKALRAFRLSDCIDAIRKLLRPGVSVLVGNQVVPFRIPGISVRSRSLQIHLKFCSGLNRLQTGAAVIHVFDEIQAAEDDVLIDIQLFRVLLQRILSGRHTEPIDGFIQKIAFRGRDLTNVPALTAGIVVSQKISVFIRHIGVHKLIITINTVNCSGECGIALGFSVRIAEFLHNAV